jgi:hypothetical protein
MKEKPVFVKLSVSLSDGSFGADLSIPVAHTDVQKKKAVEQWLELIQTGLKISATEIRATLEPLP